jgi:phosphomannomutase
MGTVLGFADIHTQSQIKSYMGAMRINSIHLKIGISNDYNFIKSIQTLSVSEDVDKDLKIAYSPLYGAGVEFIPKLFGETGYKNFYPVKEESVFNGEFPGLERPDPSDERVFAKVLEKAKEKDADIAIVTNPNLSEFGAAVKTGEGEYRILTQEEQKAMLEEYKAGFTGEKPAHAKIPGPSDIFLFAEMMAYNKKNGKL